MMNMPRNRLFMEYQIMLSEEPIDKYFALLDRRSKGEPLQYIVGSQEFMGLPFVVTPDVLIPRQDTEILAENAISLLKDRTFADGTKLEGKIRKNPDVADVCCGSGAVGVSIGKLAPKAKVTLSDLSESALKIAKTNAQKNGVNAEAVQGDLFTPFRGRFRKKTFDMIVSNPPYVRSSVIPTLQREIREHEPVMALDGGSDGLDFYRRIAKEAPEFLRKEGLLLLEIGSDQKEDVETLLEQTGAYADIRCIPDLAGLDRVVFARKKEG